MEKKTLDFALTVQDAFVLGIKNAPSIITATLLWLITFWIPYINIGTTIAMSMLPLEIAKGNIINPLRIFDSKWRRYMGEFMLTSALMFLGITLAIMFLLIPGIVLAIAWSLAYYFLLEKNMNPMQALKASNDATYGSKWSIFGAFLLIDIILLVITMILLGIGLLTGSLTMIIIMGILGLIIIIPVSIATAASTWRQLQNNA